MPQLAIKIQIDTKAAILAGKPAAGERTVMIDDHDVAPLSPIERFTLALAASNRTFYHFDNLIPFVPEADADYLKYTCGTHTVAVPPVLVEPTVECLLSWVREHAAYLMDAAQSKITEKRAAEERRKENERVEREHQTTRVRELLAKPTQELIRLGGRRSSRYGFTADGYAAYFFNENLPFSRGLIVDLVPEAAAKLAELDAMLEKANREAVAAVAEYEKAMDEEKAVFETWLLALQPDLKPRFEAGLLPEDEFTQAAKSFLFEPFELANFEPYKKLEAVHNAECYDARVVFTNEEPTSGISAEAFDEYEAIKKFAATAAFFKQPSVKLVIRTAECKTCDSYASKPYVVATVSIAAKEYSRKYEL